MTTETESATQTDVLDALPSEQTEETEPKERPKSARELAMEAIEATRAAAFETESGIKLDKPEEAPAPATGNKPAATGTEKTGDELEQQLELQTKTPTLLDALDDYTVKVKIDGVEQTVPLKQAVANFQKDAAANRRLEEATRLLREAEAKNTTAAPGAADKTTSTEATDTTAAKPAAGLKDQVKAALGALYEGDEDKAAETLAALMGGRTEPKPADAIRPEALVAQLVPALKAEMSKDAALKQFQDDYPGIVSDPDLALLADRYVDTFQRDGKSLPEAILAAGEAVATKFKLPKPKGRQTETATTTTSDTKRERKQDIDNIGGLNVSTASGEPTPQSTADVIKEMMKARGQA